MLLLHHPDPAAAEALIGASLAEVARLERQFSLYDPDSALVRLNREGALDASAARSAAGMNESAQLSCPDRRRVRRDGSAPVGPLRGSLRAAGR